MVEAELGLEIIFFRDVAKYTIFIASYSLKVDSTAHFVVLHAFNCSILTYFVEV